MLYQIVTRVVDELKIVTGHAPVAVDHVDLQVFIETAIHSAITLLNKGFEKFGKLRGFLFLSGGFDCVSGYVPSFKFLIGTGDAFVSAVAADDSFRNAPTRCCLACSDVVHFLLFLSTDLGRDPRNN